MNDSSIVYRTCGVLLGELTEAMKQERPNSSLTLSFWEGVVCFSWLESVGEYIISWTHRITFVEVLRRKLHGEILTDSILVEWRHSIAKQLEDVLEEDIKEAGG